MATWQTQVKTIATTLAVVFGLWMALSIGVGEAVQVVIDPADPANPLDANTTAVFGGQVDFVDRIAVLGVFITILGGAGLGLLQRSSNNPKFINDLLVFYPVIIGLIAFTAFSTEVWELLSGDRDWAAYADGTNAYIGFLAASMVAGIVSLLRR
jgi:hypothetical protein